MKPRIYIDFDDYFQNGNHSYGSASKEELRAIWIDLEPTINAKDNDYKLSYIQRSKEQRKSRDEMFDFALKYIEQFSKKNAPGFFYWYMNTKLGENDV